MSSDTWFTKKERKSSMAKYQLNSIPHNFTSFENSKDTEGSKLKNYKGDVKN